MIHLEEEVLEEIAVELDVASSWTSGAKASKLRALAARLRAHADGSADNPPLDVPPDDGGTPPEPGADTVSVPDQPDPLTANGD